MELPEPHCYELQLKSQAAYAVHLEGAKATGFTRPVSRVCPKLYVVMCGNEIHYVGITNRPMSARINMGLKAKGKGGYHGYKWKALKSKLRLIVWAFPNESGKPFLRQLETVEAEFAYSVRNSTGRWPLSQTEIHFYEASPLHLRVVEKMRTHCAT